MANSETGEGEARRPHCASFSPKCVKEQHATVSTNSETGRIGGSREPPRTGIPTKRLSGALVERFTPKEALGSLRRGIYTPGRLSGALGERYIPPGRHAGCTSGYIPPGRHAGCTPGCITVYICLPVYIPGCTTVCICPPVYIPGCTTVGMPPCVVYTRVCYGGYASLGGYNPGIMVVYFPGWVYPGYTMVGMPSLCVCTGYTMVGMPPCVYITRFTVGLVKTLFSSPVSLLG